ncbi:hypothetical protein DVA67_007130 [Solirubrobacter sp. CPCC 204708]|uniref:Bacterial transcriptional activator domain-containing protein n=1 Tax=Solirubrobacter deserti TaxID=2282478 RepID=A0ABT4RPN2_9ACTN|nr:BTAD domain-containing putative transcriptional regulator [Solirubrobacter deserti]MBE2315742.1 hypothetical protein [Solirubrobacter deserti]MDA0140368.1 hypothetical protein [Solirubrobacter deserti]
MPRVVSRPRITHRLAAALDDGHALLVAPAGYGKTTAALEAVAGRSPVAWHPCRRGHGDPFRLLAGLAAAVERAQPGLAGGVLDALADPGDPLALGGLLARDLDRLLVDDLVLVVDDAEHLKASDDAVGLLDVLLETQRLRMLLCTRVELPLRSRAALQMTRVTADELVFSGEDTAALLEDRLGREASDEEVQSVLDRTLGWPLGIALGSGLAEDHDPEVLAARLLDRVDEAARAALLDSCVVDEVTLGVARALGVDVAAGHSAGLVARPGLADGSVAWHPLVREALRAVWRRTVHEPRQRSVLGRAGRALVADGQTLAGAEALMAGGDHAAALDALLEDADRLLRRTPATVAALLDALPASVDEPAALVLRGWLDSVRGHAAAAVGPLQEGLRRLEDEGRAHDGAGARLALCESLYFLGRLDEAIVEAGRLADDPGAPVPHAWIAAAWRALYEAAAGRPEQARLRIGEVLARDRTGAAAGLIASAGAFIAAPVGRHEVAIAELDAAYARMIGRERAAGRPEYLSSLAAFLLADIGEREEAVRRADRMVSDREPDGLPPFVAALAYGLQAWTRALAGDFAGADVAFVAAEAAGPPDGWPFGFGLASRAIVAAARGEPAVAAAERALRVGATMPDAHYAMLAVELASCLLVARDPGAALAILDTLLTRLPETSTYPRARALALRAAARAAHGEPWMDDARAAFALIDRPNLTRLLAADWRHLRPLAWSALDLDDRRDGALAGDGTRAAVLAAVPAEDLPDFAAHPAAATRAAVAPPLARTGHPAVGETLAALADDRDETVRRAAQAALEDLHARPLPLRFRLLGGFAVARGGWPVDDRAWTRPTAARLVRYLLVAGGPVDEDRVAHDLWPDHDGEAARGALRMAVSRARQVLDAHRAGPSLLNYRDRTYRLELTCADEVDAWRYRTEAEQALDASGPQRRLLLIRADELYTGEPLPEERYADWAEPWREELISLRRRVLHALALEHRRAGDEHATAAIARRLIASDELDESAHRLLITALSRSGLRSLALRQYLECRRRLIDGAGLEPDAETAALQQRLLAGLPV